MRQLRACKKVIGDINLITICNHSIYICFQEEELHATFESAKTELPQKIAAYLVTQWISCANLWAAFGRLFCHNESDTNNISERY